MSIKIEVIWQKLVSNISPEAAHLKYLFRERWIRFHSLPESKRYPDNDQEKSITIHQHNSILNYIWSVKSPLILIHTTMQKLDFNKKEANWSFWKSIDL